MTEFMYHGGGVRLGWTKSLPDTFHGVIQLARTLPKHLGPKLRVQIGYALPNKT